MFAPTLLLSAVLGHLPSPGIHVAMQGALPWVTATVLGARLHRDLGLTPAATVGFRSGRPQVLAVVAIEPPWALPVTAPAGTVASLPPKVPAAADGSGAVRAEVCTATAFFKMAVAARQAGVVLQVNSGFRTDEEQQELYDLYRQGRGPLAARPGNSNHQSGHALDLDTRVPKVRRWLQRHAFRFGFRRTVSSERWHYEYWDVAEQDLAGSLRK